MFGSAVPSGMNLAGVKAQKQVAPLAYETALELLSKDYMRALDKGFYEEVESPRFS